MSLRIVPNPSHATSTTNTASKSSKNPSSQDLSAGAPSAPGLHDTLRSSLSSTSSQPTTSTPSSTHPLETRLTQWTQTQTALRSQLLRRNFGIAEPLRRGMELKMVREVDSFRPSVLGAPSSVHEEILTGRDAEISWEDIYANQDGVKLGSGMEGGQGVVGWHEEMERKVGMGKW